MQIAIIGPTVKMPILYILCPQQLPDQLIGLT